MNEQIKQLYEQAHIERRQEYFSSVVDPTIKSVSVTRQFDPDLFAELIVRECANIAFDEYAATNGADSGESAILKHFGVEE